MEPNSVCHDLPKLTQQDLYSNHGNQYLPPTSSPSLYEDIFDEKRFNDLISDPLLNTGQMEMEKNENGTWNNSSSINSTRPGQGALQLTENGAENGSNVWNGQNYYQNGFGDASFDLGSAGTSGHVQPQIPSSLFSTPAWQTGQVVTAEPGPASRPLMSSNSGLQSRASPRAPFLRVKTELPESEQNGDDHSVDSQLSPSTSRGAVYAREYRRKNKTRIGKLEQDNERLWRENDALKRACREACEKANSLSREVTYLRQVLANDGAIANLLNAVVTNAPGLKFQCPLTSDQKAQENSTATSTKRRPPEGSVPNAVSKQRKMDENEVRQAGEGVQKSGESPGVCLHVNGDMVSVEFCPRCNRDARRGAGDLQ